MNTHHEHRPDAQDQDVVDVLLAQHARIEELFHSVLHGNGRPRQEAFEDLVRLLAVHETAEEEVVHPYARTVIDEGHAVIEARLAEEREGKKMLAALHANGVDAPDFEQRVRELRDAVLAHAKHEERYEFPQLRQHTDAKRLRTMASAVRVAEAMAPTRPHPGVESAKANLLLGPPLAIMDRARDLIRGALR